MEVGHVKNSRLETGKDGVDLKENIISWRLSAGDVALLTESLPNMNGSLVLFPAPNKPAMEVLAVISALGGGGMESGGSEVQAHPQLHNKFSASMGYMRLCLKKKKVTIHQVI